MPDPSLQRYFEINATGYQALVDTLLADTQALQPTSDDNLTAARRKYFETAIAKGADVSTLISSSATLSARGLAQEAERLPDKQAEGWRGLTSLTPKDRQDFSDAAKNRVPDEQLDTIFPAGQNDIIIKFYGNPQSTGNKIEDLIVRHNEQAKAKFTQTHEEDILNPSRRPIAGKAIGEQLVRLTPDRDPQKPATLQIYTPDGDAWLSPEWAPNGNNWKPGPRLGKFLQDQREWELFDIIQRSTEAKHKNPSNSDVSAVADDYDKLRSLANQAAQNADQIFNTDNLRVMVSRDPQKIGEMSTGQRWRSCMANDGVNYGFVPQDIQAGSLVAYVIHQDDTEARYPLMRQLIKPFRNNQGETVLVPSRVYGGEGNSLTVDALNLTLRQFVDQYNAGKSGQFEMDKRLYGDGQSTLVTLGKDWPHHAIVQALSQYRESSLTEWMVELRANIDRSANGRRGDHDEDPMDNVRGYKNKIIRLYESENSETGLPRMFFRETLMSSIGVIPEPSHIIDAAIDPNIQHMGAAFKALREGNRSEWESRSQYLPPLERTALAANVATLLHSELLVARSDAEKGGNSNPELIESLTDRENLAASIWTRLYQEIEKPAATNIIKFANDVVPGSALDREMKDIADKAILEGSNRYEQYQIAKNFLPIGAGPIKHAYQLRAADTLLDKFSTQTSGDADFRTNVDEAANIYFRAPEHSPQRERAGSMVMDNIASMQKIENFTSWGIHPSSHHHTIIRMVMAANLHNENTDLQKRIFAYAIDQISSVHDFNERLRMAAWIGSRQNVDAMSKQKTEALIDKEVEGLKTAKERFDVGELVAKEITDRNRDFESRFSERHYIGLLDKLPILNSSDQRAGSAYLVLKSTAKEFPYIAERAREIVLNNIHAIDISQRSDIESLISRISTENNLRTDLKNVNQDTQSNRIQPAVPQIHRSMNWVIDVQDEVSPPQGKPAHSSLVQNGMDEVTAAQFIQKQNDTVQLLRERGVPTMKISIADSSKGETSEFHPRTTPWPSPAPTVRDTGLLTRIHLTGIAPSSDEDVAMKRFMDTFTEIEDAHNNPELAAYLVRENDHNADYIKWSREHPPPPDRLTVRDHMKASGVEHVVMSGTTAGFCVTRNALSAAMRGMDVTILTDQVVGWEDKTHTRAVWHQDAPRHHETEIKESLEKIKRYPVFNGFKVSDQAAIENAIKRIKFSTSSEYISSLDAEAHTRKIAPRDFNEEANNRRQTGEAPVRPQQALLDMPGAKPAENPLTLNDRTYENPHDLFPTDASRLLEDRQPEAKRQRQKLVLNSADGARPLQQKIVQDKNTAEQRVSQNAGIVFHGEITPEIRQGMQEEYNEIKPWFGDYLREQGAKFKVGQVMEDILPRAPYDGDTRSIDINRETALYDRDQNLVAMAEYSLDGKRRSREGQRPSIDDPEGLWIKRPVNDMRQAFKHELWHTIDRNFGYPSRSPSFQDAYTRDLERLGGPEGASDKGLWYLTDINRGAGRLETFAETGAQLDGVPDDVIQHFSDCATWMKNFKSEVETAYRVGGIHAVRQLMDDINHPVPNFSNEQSDLKVDRARIGVTDNSSPIFLKKFDDLMRASEYVPATARPILRGVMADYMYEIVWARSDETSRTHVMRTLDKLESSGTQMPDCFRKFIDDAPKLEELVREQRAYKTAKTEADIRVLGMTEFATKFGAEHIVRQFADIDALLSDGEFARHGPAGQKLRNNIIEATSVNLIALRHLSSASALSPEKYSDRVAKEFQNLRKKIAESGYPEVHDITKKLDLIESELTTHYANAYQRQRGGNSKVSEPYETAVNPPSSKTDQRMPEITEPNIVLVNRRGEFIENAGADPLPPSWEWAADALHRLQDELKATGNARQDTLKQKLVNVFNQHNGHLILTEGDTGLAFLYKPENSLSGKSSLLDRAIVWAGTKIFGTNKGNSNAGGFLPLYRNGEPNYQIVFNAKALPTFESATIKGAGGEDFGDSREVTIKNLPLLHELTHAGIQAGHFLTVQVSDRQSYQDSGHRSYEGTTLKTPGFQMLKDSEHYLYTGSTTVVSDYKFKKYEEYKSKPDTLEDEVLAYGTADYFSRTSPSHAPLVGSFLDHIMSYDLSLIQRGDYASHSKLLEALGPESETTKSLSSALLSLAESIKNKKGDVEALRIIRNEFASSVDGILGQTVDNLKIAAAPTKSVTIEAQRTPLQRQASLAQPAPPVPVQPSATITASPKASPLPAGTQVNGTTTVSPKLEASQTPNPNTVQPPSSTDGTPKALAINAMGSSGIWNAKLEGVNGHVGTAAIAIGMADAAIKGDVKQAAEIAGTAGALHVGIKGVALIAGAKAVPVAGQVVGAVFAGKDAYDSVVSGNSTRAVVSGSEATLYTVAAGAGIMAATNFWNPLGWAAAPVAAVAGGTAVAITASKAAYDNWNTVKGWFGYGDNDPGTPHDQPQKTPDGNESKPPDLIAGKPPTNGRGILRVATADVLPQPHEERHAAPTPSPSVSAAVPLLALKRQTSTTVQV